MSVAWTASRCVERDLASRSTEARDSLGVEETDVVALFRAVIGAGKVVKKQPVLRFAACAGQRGCLPIRIRRAVAVLSTDSLSFGSIASSTSCQFNGCVSRVDGFSLELL